MLVLGCCCCCCFSSFCGCGCCCCCCRCRPCLYRRRCCASWWCGRRWRLSSCLLGVSVFLVAFQVQQEEMDNSRVCQTLALGHQSLNSEPLRGTPILPVVGFGGSGGVVVWSLWSWWRWWWSCCGCWGCCGCCGRCSCCGCRGCCGYCDWFRCGCGCGCGGCRCWSLSSSLLSLLVVIVCVLVLLVVALCWHHWLSLLPVAVASRSLVTFGIPLLFILAMLSWLILMLRSPPRPPAAVGPAGWPGRRRAFQVCDLSVFDGRAWAYRGKDGEQRPRV